MRRAAVVAALGAATLALPTPASAHRTGQAVVAEETTSVERATDNVELVAHHFFPEGTDMQFQRREGRQRLDGRTVHGTRDYVFVGGDAKSDLRDGAVQVFDITDPTLPVHLAEIPCKGYHAEIAVHEDLLFQGIDSARSNEGCAEGVPGAEQHDEAGVAGIRVYDVSDPARPRVAGFIGPDDGLESVHNMTVVPWADLLYLSLASFDVEDPTLGIVDLSDPSLPLTFLSIRDWSRDAFDGCHDIGLDPDRELAFCPAIENTLVWDISDPFAPEHLSTIYNPKITIHHGARLAPDGTTLVLNDEHAGAADINVPTPGDVGVGANGCTGDPTTGALWFYDVSDPASPQLQGAFAPRTPEPTASPCTSHFYNFIPGTTLVVTGWYEAGIVVTDYADPSLPAEHAVFLPELGNYWSAYYWHGYLYGASRTVRDKGFGGGLWVVQLDGVGDVAPAPQDEGTSWARWTGPEPSGAPGERGGGHSARGAGALPTTGGGIALAAVVVGAAGVVGRRR